MDADWQVRLGSQVVVCRSTVTCQGTVETTTVTAIQANSRTTKESKSVTITVNLENGFAFMQNLGHVAFIAAKEPVVCVITPAEIRCGKEHGSSNDMSFAYWVLINRYSGLLTEYQTITSGAEKTRSLHRFLANISVSR